MPECGPFGALWWGMWETMECSWSTGLRGDEPSGLMVVCSSNLWETQVQFSAWSDFLSAHLLLDWYRCMHTWENLSTGMYVFTCLYMVPVRHLGHYDWLLGQEHWLTGLRGDGDSGIVVGLVVLRFIIYIYIYIYIYIWCVCVWQFHIVGWHGYTRWTGRLSHKTSNLSHPHNLLLKGCDPCFAWYQVQGEKVVIYPATVKQLKSH